LSSVKLTKELWLSAESILDAKNFSELTEINKDEYLKIINKMGYISNADPANLSEKETHLT